VCFFFFLLADVHHRPPLAFCFCPALPPPHLCFLSSVLSFLQTHNSFFPAVFRFFANNLRFFEPSLTPPSLCPRIKIFNLLLLRLIDLCIARFSVLFTGLLPQFSLDWTPRFCSLLPILVGKEPSLEKPGGGHLTHQATFEVELLFYAFAPQIMGVSSGL